MSIQASGLGLLPLSAALTTGSRQDKPETRTANVQLRQRSTAPRWPTLLTASPLGWQQPPPAPQPAEPNWSWMLRLLLRSSPSTSSSFPRQSRLSWRTHWPPEPVSEKIVLIESDSTVKK
jgi:hypothetical protein